MAWQPQSVSRGSHMRETLSQRKWIKPALYAEKSGRIVC